VVAAGEQGGTLGGQQDAERVGDHLLRATVSGTAGALTPSAPASGRVGRAPALVNRFLEDQVERRAPGLDAGGRVEGLLLLLPQVDVRAQDARERLVLELGEQVLLDVALVVLHGRGRQVLGLVPAVRVLAEGLLTEGRVAPVAATVLVLGLGRCPLGLALSGEPDRLAVLVDDRVVLAGRDLVPAAPVASALLRETQVPLSPSSLSSATADAIGSRDSAVLLLSTRRAGPQTGRRRNDRAARLPGAGLRTGLGERLGHPCDCLRRLGRPLLVEADDLGEVLGGEAVGAADPRVRY